jgi:hypothetical protein
VVEASAASGGGGFGGRGGGIEGKFGQYRRSEVPAKKDCTGAGPPHRYRLGIRRPSSVILLEAST